MKKIISTTIVAIILTFFGPHLSAEASTLGLSPNNATLKPGDTFTMGVSINPQGDSIYTAKVSLNFSSDVLEVTNWNFSGGWSALSQSGYDQVDNNGGHLIKTAGYPGGLNNAASFGTVTFRVKKEGSASVTVSNNSALYDENNTNSLTGNASARFTSTAAAPNPSEVQRGITTSQPVAKNTLSKSVSKSTTSSDVVVTDTETASSSDVNANLANVSAGKLSPTSTLLLSILLALALGFVAGRSSIRWV